MPSLIVFRCENTPGIIGPWMVSPVIYKSKDEAIEHIGNTYKGNKEFSVVDFEFPFSRLAQSAVVPK